VQIYLLNTDFVVVDGCYSNLGSPNIAVDDGGGNTNVRLMPTNNFAGVVDFTAGTYP
jgi:hypothetical protein